MTPQESTMLNDLVSKIKQTDLPEKDEEAEQFLKQSLAGTPDAQYILAQTVLVQNIALNQAKAQVQQLQQQLQNSQSQAQQLPAPAQHTSFLGSLLGRHDATPPPQSFPPQGYPPRAAAPPAYYPPPPAYAPDYAAAPQYAPPPPSGGSSFLRSAATTAAGVAAGALAFEGVESILHGFGHGEGFGGGGFGGGGFGGGGVGERPVEDTVINNYYDDPNQNRGGEERGGREASFDGGDRFGNDDRGAQFNDASYDTSGGGVSDLDQDPRTIDTLDDDQTTGGFDDSGNFDDGGGDDSNVI
jgi:hypothetical protein